jgi:phosphoglycolate phosphatase
LDAFVDKHYDQFIDQHLVVLPGATDLLRTAFELTGGKVACVTNCPEKLTARLLAHCGFDRYFGDRVVCAGMSVPKPSTSSSAAGKVVLPPKPHPDSAQYACHLLGLKPSQCVLIGDSKYDVQAGVAAGVQTIGIHITGHARVEKTADVLAVLTPRLPPPTASAASAAAPASKY